MSRPLTLLARIARDALRAHDGLAHVRQLDAAGLSRTETSRLLHEGVLRRPRIGWYVEADAPPQALAAVTVGGILGCVSAAEALGIAVPPRSRRTTHVSLLPDATRMRRSTDSRRRAPAGTDRAVRLHWERRLDPAHGWRVSAVDAIVQLAGCVPIDWLVAAIDSARNAAQHAPLLAEEDVARLRAALPEHLRRAVDLSDPGAGSSGETLIRLELRRRRIPCTTQAVLAGRYFGDLLIDGWLPVESDGIANHSGAAVERDRRRDAVIALEGHPPLRFTQKAVEEDVASVVDVIEAVWRRGDPARRSGESPRRSA